MSNQPVTPQTETFSFQAEVSKVLDIVINSLYTDREIFVRELISNSADALEKIRHISLTQEKVAEKDLPMEIRIDVDEKNKTFTIQDTGIGMTREELIENLGSIAHSGAKDFIAKLAENKTQDVQLIGQFGVGFYASFMVSDQVTVQTRSYSPDAQGWEWISDGSEGYTISPCENLTQGTKIVLTLKKDDSQFSTPFTIREAIKKYSNFVPFPIYLNGDKVNTVQAIWTRNKTEISDEEYMEFYKFLGAYDEPLNWLHFSTDAPLSLHALLFIPKDNVEKFGMMKLDSQVDLHCRKVLIQKAAKGILPDWLRFVKGVVDSEDIPLNISRETMQDSSLLRKIKKALTGRFVKHMTSIAKTDGDLYKKFWQTFGNFIKEGIISHDEQKDSLAELVRFETSQTEPGQFKSFKEYVEGMVTDQKEIYFLSGPNRESILNSPYMELFTKRNIEVIFNYDTVDDFVMSHLKEYDGKQLIPAESEKVDLPEEPQTDQDDSQEKPVMKDDEIQDLQQWIKATLGERVKEVKASKRLVDSPVILVNPEGQLTSAMQRLMLSMNKEFHTMTAYTLEFNPSHAIVQNLDTMRHIDNEFAATILEQIFDQAVLTAGFHVDTRQLVDRMYSIIDRSLEPLPIKKEISPDDNGTE